MAEPKKPQDHLPKKADHPDLDEHFSFGFGGETYTMPVATADGITPGWVRKNRRRDNTDFTFTALEVLAGEGEEGKRILAVLDNMPMADFRAFQTDFGTHLGAALGE